MVSTLSFDGVLFDLGNTLIPFTPKDSMEFVVKWYNASVRDTERLPFRTFLETYRTIVKRERHLSAEGAWESSVRERSEMIVGSLEGNGIRIQGLLDELMENHTDAFTSCLRIKRPSLDVLRSLGSFINENGEPLRLGLISNAIDAKAIRTFLRENELERFFGSVIISEEAGMAKPRREIFDMALKDLSLSPERSVYVGDRYHTDVEGSRSAGMFPVYIREYHTAGEPPEGTRIDAPCIESIMELIPLLEKYSRADNKG